MFLFKIILIPALLLGVLATAFFVTLEEQSFASELAFVEHSSDGLILGSVVPASCESVPPKSHYPGDCPVRMEVGIRTTPNPISVFVTQVIFPSARYVYNNTTGAYIWWTGGPVSISEGPYTVDGISVRLDYTSTGATKCYLFKGNEFINSVGSNSLESPIPVSGEIHTRLAYNTYINISIKCTDGVYWASSPVLTALSTVDPSIEMCTGGGGNCTSN